MLYISAVELKKIILILKIMCSDVHLFRIYGLSYGFEKLLYVNSHLYTFYKRRVFINVAYRKRKTKHDKSNS